jgi:3-hydroxyisobutyrate dehydrogenase
VATKAAGKVLGGIRMKVGYLGLGAMGGMLARRLVGSHDLTVWDLNRKAVDDLAALGAATATSAADLARRCDAILLCLPRTAAVRDAIFGPAGLAEGLSPGKIVVDQPSGVPGETNEIAGKLAARGVGMIDAPVAGGVAAAAAGTVTVIASGGEKDWHTARPVLEGISTKVFRCGARVGDGQALKLVNNAIGAGYRMATLECAAVGRKLGLSLRAVTDALNRGAGANFTSRNMLPAIVEGRPATNFALSLMIKDLNEAIALGTGHGAPMPVTAMARGMMQICLNTCGKDARLDDVVRGVEIMADVALADRGEPDHGPAAGPDRAEIERAIDGAVEVCNELALYECVAVGIKYGLGVEALATILNAGSASSAASERILPALAEGVRPSGIPLGAAIETLRRATALGAACGVPMLIANAARASVEAAGNEFGPETDTGILAKVHERMAGVGFS